MRTTLNLDDDIWAAAKALAKRERRSVGEILSELARQGLSQQNSHLVTEQESFYGFRPFPAGERVVTNELIDKLRDEDVY